MGDYISAQALDPKWHEVRRVHDWRNYIGERARSMWDSFTDEQKIALALDADEEASGEHWD